MDIQAEKPKSPNLRPGVKVGHIRIVDQLGAGGMGVLYVGFDETLRRKVALKAIAGRHRMNAPARARFVREARILSQLDHPNICRIFDFVQDGGSEYLVLELIDGQDLSAAVAAGLEPRKKLQVVRDIAEKLNNDDNIIWFSVSAENFESIHNHSAYAHITSAKGNHSRPDIS